MAVQTQKKIQAPTPPPNKVETPTFNPPGENIYPATSISVTISTTTTGAQIRYTLDGTTPTETYGTLINGSSGQTNSFNPGTLGKTLNAIAFKSGMTDSDVESEDYTRESGGMGPMGLGGGTMTMPQTMVTTTIYSVWDGDWAILEEYDNTGARVQGYVQGYHGLVKTLVDNIYYYQDELGSTSHIADSAGQLLEYYKYDLYGKPTYFDSTSQQLNGSTYGAAILGNGGSRWMPELGLYDSRNRFMSPDLGRFLQPDPIGFKGDASNLYRYCGNDWANRTDLTGLLTDGGSDKEPESQPVEIDNDRKDCAEGLEDDSMRSAVNVEAATSYQRSQGNSKYDLGTGDGIISAGIPSPEGKSVGQVTWDGPGKQYDPTDSNHIHFTPDPIVVRNPITGGQRLANAKSVPVLSPAKGTIRADGKTVVTQVARVDTYFHPNPSSTLTNNEFKRINALREEASYLNLVSNHAAIRGFSDVMSGERTVESVTRNEWETFIRIRAPMHYDGFNRDGGPQ